MCVKVVYIFILSFSIFSFALESNNSVNIRVI
jgi:hypothetical protein